MSGETNITNTTTSDPWVESGAMVYVALTVATCSAVIMCCTWFMTHNIEILRWWNGDSYGIVNEEEHVELQTVEELDEEETIFEATKHDEGAFTLDESSDENDNGEEDGEEDVLYDNSTPV